MLHLKLFFDSVGIDFGPSVWGKLFAIDQTWKIAAKFWHFDVLRLIVTDTFHFWILKYVYPPFGVECTLPKVVFISNGGKRLTCHMGQAV